MTMTTAAISLVHVFKVYGSRPSEGLVLLRKGTSRDQLREQGHVVAVDDVSLEVKAGEIFVVMGLSGSGKSTLIRCINRLVEPTDGQIFVEGEEITRLGISQLRNLRVRKLGMVFQHFALFPHLTVLDNIAFGLRVIGVPRHVRRKRAGDVLRLVGLESWGDKKPSQLSGGMQQRVGLARALALDSPILLMDEPFGSLDPLIREGMQRELIHLQQRLNKTVVFITHDFNEAITVGSRVAILRDGQVVQEGRPVDIVLNPRDDYVRAFVHDVNVLKLLKAEQAVDYDFPVLRLDTPVPLPALSQTLHRPIVVLDQEDRLLGTVEPASVDDCMSGMRWREVLSRDFVRLPADALLGPHLGQIGDTKKPVFVVGRADRYLGAITAESILRAIASVRTPHRTLGLPPSANEGQ
jgi:glycine betaine/proline transport system ATP-binding protein